MQRRIALAALAGALAGTACHHAPAGAAPSSSAPAAAAPEAPGVSVTAGKLDKPAPELSKDDVEAALAKGGWRVVSATETSSAGHRTILVGASKGPWTATVKVYTPPDDFWVHQLEKDQGAIERRGNALVGVVIAGKPDEARILLDSLLGK